MTWLQSLKVRFRALFVRGRMDAEMDEELRFHIEMETKKNIRMGMDPVDARRRALVAFGGVEQAREKTREARGISGLDDLSQDLRYALRQLRKNPGFSLVAILTLALGIGATTTIFSVVDGILLTPLPYDQPDRLVRVWPERPFSKSMLTEFRGQVPFFKGLTAHRHETFVLTGDGTGDPEELGGGLVSFDHFRVLGVAPAMGRAFTPDDELPGQGQVVILSHGLWQRRFGSDPEILGRSISIGEGPGAMRTVVGVMPSDYRPLYDTWRLWVPFQIDPDNFPDFAGTASLRLMGRLADGISVDAAGLRFNGVANRLTAEKSFVTDEERALAGVQPLVDALVGDVRTRLLILLGSVGLVLLLACINVANLLLVRGQSRERELGVRVAVGANRRRVVRQLLTESLVLGMAGGALGLLFAYGSLPLLVGILPSGVPRVDLISLDGRVLLFSLATALASALIFGLIPAFKATSRDPQQSLRDGGRGRGQGPSGQKLRNGLVVAELALAVVVVVGASLLFKSFWLLRQQDPGFQASQVLTLRLNLPADRYPDGISRHVFLEEVSREVETLPGVTDVGWTSFLPMASGGMGIRYHSDESTVAMEEQATYAEVRVFSPGFLSALRIPMVQGEYPLGLMGDEEQEVVLVNRSLARSLWPQGETPLDKTVWLPFGSDLPARISGMVEDFSQTSLDRDIQPGIYIPWELWTPARMYMAVRTTGDPAALIPDVRARIWAVDQQMPIKYVRTMDEVVGRTMADSRLTTLLLMVFGALALTLGAVGVYGVASYAVSESTYEIGVRLALGAGKEGILLGTLQRFLGIAGLGILLGLAGAFGTSRVLAGFLFQVSSTDPVTFLGVGAFLTLVALLASLVPALRASRVDPAHVLKEE